MNKKALKTVILMIIMAALILGCYLYLSRRNKEKSSPQKQEEKIVTEMTAAQKLIAQAPYMDYPATPVQLLKYYNELTRIFYNESFSEDEIAKLASIARGLYDEELKSMQSDTDYLEALKADIANMHQINFKLYKSDVSPSTDVEYFEHEGRECAKLYCTYEEQSGGLFQTAREVFILRKDDEGHWKILGFKLVKEGDENGGS
ncbi:MAG: hypothetical protein K5686_07355 [Lachnospiraceae bacterium]|nr:hypothetical protein [Lachnospiraceae bacterium]